MPHKTNPVRATLIAAAARQLPGLAAVLYGSLAAEDERPAGAWHAEWQPLRDALRLTGGAARDAAELTAHLRVHPRRMRQNLDATGGLVVTERLVAALTALTGRAEARRILDTAARRTAERDIELPAALDETLDEALPMAPCGALPTAPCEDRPAPSGGPPAPRGVPALSPSRLRQLLDPTGYLGSADALVDRALERPEHPAQELP